VSDEYGIGRHVSNLFVTQTYEGQSDIHGESDALHFATSDTTDQTQPLFSAAQSLAFKPSVDCFNDLTLSHVSGRVITHASSNKSSPHVYHKHNVASEDFDRDRCVRRCAVEWYLLAGGLQPDLKSIHCVLTTFAEPVEDFCRGRVQIFGVCATRPGLSYMWGVSI
jgi:hypothetical protein